jgi:hypothetical protein
MPLNACFLGFYFDENFGYHVDIYIDSVLMMSRLTSHERRLQSLLSSVSNFESDMKELMLWLTKAEVVLMHHDEMTVANSSCTESEQQWHKLEQSFIVSFINFCRIAISQLSFQLEHNITGDSLFLRVCLCTPPVFDCQVTNSVSWRLQSSHA